MLQIVLTLPITSDQNFIIYWRYFMHTKMSFFLFLSFFLSFCTNPTIRLHGLLKILKYFISNSVCFFGGRISICNYFLLHNNVELLGLKQLTLWIKITAFLPFSNAVNNDHVIIWPVLGQDTCSLITKLMIDSIGSRNHLCNCHLVSPCAQPNYGKGDSL